ncbi:MAG: energy-coupling factor transporter transmembrane protein EcfT [Clostridiales bacterium]|jgi:energy-coupling factor transport system permease protein|nr:energy-coupling factor transporter transmembrane protein EcfT [Clostridiales bacterium]
MKRITIGQFYPGDSVIHKLDARVKLLGTLLFITALFFVGNFSGYIAGAVFIVALVQMSRVPFKLLIKGLRSVIFILLFAAFLNIFLTPGEDVVFSFSFIRVTREGLSMAGRMATRLVLLITGSSVLTLTTSPIRLTDAIEYLLMPLKIFKVPAHEIAMMMTIAMSSIAMLMDETEKIMKAQAARGADFETGGLIKKAKSLIPVMVPLFYSAFRRADEMAAAMESRCYRGGENRTRLKPMKMTGNDYIAAVILAGSVILILMVGILI